jgi:hypothetical protein
MSGVQFAFIDDIEARWLQRDHQPLAHTVLYCHLSPLLLYGAPPFTLAFTLVFTPNVVPDVFVPQSFDHGSRATRCASRAVKTLYHTPVFKILDLEIL